MEPFDHDWWIRATCRAKYSHLESTSPTDQTVWCTIAITVFTILLELLAHSNCRSVSCGNYDPRISPESRSKEAPIDPFLHSCDDAEPCPSQQVHNSNLNEQNYSTRIRDYLSLPTLTLLRLVASTLLLLAVLAAFCIRILDAITTPTLQEECIPVIHPVPPNWVIIWLLNIFPLISSCSAFVLVVYNTVLTWRAEKLGHEPRQARCVWPLGKLFATILLAITVLTASLMLVARFIMMAVMGLRGRLGKFMGTTWEQSEMATMTGDVEMHDEVRDSGIGNTNMEIDDEDIANGYGQRSSAYEQLHRGFMEFCRRE
ncbi:hypothetical protein M3J09_001220 [Ascochyta lentis]